MVYIDDQKLNPLSEDTAQEELDKPFDGKKSKKVSNLKPEQMDPLKARFSTGKWTLLACLFMLAVVLTIDTVFTAQGIIKSDLLASVFDFIKSVVLIVLGYIFSKEQDK